MLIFLQEDLQLLYRVAIVLDVKVDILAALESLKRAERVELRVVFQEKIIVIDRVKMMPNVIVPGLERFPSRPMLCDMALVVWQTSRRVVTDCEHGKYPFWECFKRAGWHRARYRSCADT